MLQKIPGQGGGAFAAQSLQYGIVGCDGTPGGALRLQQAAAFQILQGALHGIGVDARIGGQLPKITDLSWSGKNAVWDNIEGCDGYEVCLKKDGKTLVTVTSKGTSYDFSDYINNAGSYVFTVRAVSTYGSQNSSWSAGSEPYILSVEDAWYSDNGNWKKTGNKWRFVYKDESYPACSWREIKEKWYYFDGNGYMVTNCYVKALGENLYYWISEDGVWDENETTATPNRAKYLVY